MTSPVAGALPPVPSRGPSALSGLRPVGYLDRWRGARVGIIYPARDPLSPSSWSGTPHGLSRGFVACGVEVVPIGHNFPRGIREAEAIAARVAGGLKHDAVRNRAWTRRQARVWTFERQIRRAGELDAIVAMGTDAYPLGAIRAGAPIVSYDDGTLLQMWRNPESDIRNSGYPINRIEKWIDVQSHSIRAAATVCVSTGWAARSMIEDLGIPESRVHVVGMGHRSRTPVEGLRDWSKPKFLFVGVEWRRKNGDVVVRAFHDVRRRHPNATLHLVGEHDRVVEEGVVDHGYLPRDDHDAQLLLDELFSSATAFVLPSRFDPSPIAYLEAASAGMPVIATTAGGAGELIGEGAISVEPDDVDGLVQAMERLAHGETARSLGAKAHQAVSTSTWAHVACRVLDATLNGEGTP
jgi:glycosyltransferase involved in cell wall biosynthesis